MTNEDIKVLIVDEVNSIKKIIRPTLIKELGFNSNNIFEVHDGRKALEKLNSEQFDLVLCEWDIPGISGIDLLRAIRKHVTLSTLPFIILTGRSDQRHILEAAQAKVSQYVIKPFTPDSFSKKLNLVLSAGKSNGEKQQRITKSNEIILLHKGKPYTSGTISNISKGGLIAKLLVQRAVTIYDMIDLKISLIDSSSGKNLVNTIQGEIIRIERIPEANDKKSAYYTFRFLSLDESQNKFIQTVIAWLAPKDAAPAKA